MPFQTCPKCRLVYHYKLGEDVEINKCLLCTGNLTEVIVSSGEVRPPVAPPTYCVAEGSVPHQPIAGSCEFCDNSYTDHLVKLGQELRYCCLSCSEQLGVARVKVNPHRKYEND